MEFEWDPAKNEANLRKHGIDFVDAVAIWDGFVVTMRSMQTGHGETRYLAIGLEGDREIAVIYTWRAGAVRLVSARRARRHERRKYWTAARPN